MAVEVPLEDFQVRVNSIKESDLSFTRIQQNKNQDANMLYLGLVQIGPRENCLARAQLSGVRFRTGRLGLGWLPGLELAWEAAIQTGAY